MKLVRLIEMCLNETYSEVCIGKHLSESFSIQNGLKQGYALSPLLFKFTLAYAITKVQKRPGWTEIEWDTSAYADNVNLLRDNMQEDWSRNKN
jgi:hypothetical protein